MLFACGSALFESQPAWQSRRVANRMAKSPDSFVAPSAARRPVCCARTCRHPPTRVWKGSDLPAATSEHGGAVNVRQLRDPAVYKEAGCVYLFYTVRGEGGIAMAQLNITSGPVRSAC